MSHPAELWPYPDSHLLAGSAVPERAYYMSADELSLVEHNLVASMRQVSPGLEGVAAILVSGSHYAADFGRTHETEAFKREQYDFHAAMAQYEASSSFLYTVDMDAGIIAHTKRVVRAVPGMHRLTGGRTGLEMIDDRLSATDLAQAGTLAELLDYHQITDTETCLNIATNSSTGRAPLSREKPYGLLSYKAIFELTRQEGIDHVFAYLNQQAIRSLSHLGLSYGLLGGREFHLPRVGAEEGYDMAYQAVCIDATPENIAIFSQANPARPFTQLVAGHAVPLFYL